MSLSPNSKLVQRAIELNYTNKKRSRSFKWIVANAVFLIIFVYDLSCKCPGYTSVLHYVELLCSGVLAANLVQYAVCLAPRRTTKLPLSPEQQKLLGLSTADLDSSFILTGREGCAREEPAPEPWGRASPLAAPPAPAVLAAAAAAAPAPPAAFDCDADGHSIADYLERCAASAGPAPPYQLAAVDAGGAAAEESAPAGSPRAWWRLQLDPRRLTQWNLNLRLWLHATLLARLVRGLRAADAALARLALAEAGALRAGRVPAARLRPLAAQAPALAPLVPFLEPFPDQRYVVRRLHELARGGCLSAYRWDGGGAGWEPARPTDAELLLHLFGAYLEAQRPPGAAPPDEPAVVRLGARPPHYALRVRGETLDVGRGRNNLLHTLLLLLAAAARRDPPALARTHLGPAGLNMLWIIGR